MMKKLMLSVVLLSAMILAASSLMAASVPGVDETSIKIGILTDFSGPGKHPGTKIYHATKVWLDNVSNPSLRGVGRQVHRSRRYTRWRLYHSICRAIASPRLSMFVSAT